MEVILALFDLLSTAVISYKEIRLVELSDKG